MSFFFFNDTATTEIYTLSLHDALPICACHVEAISVRTSRMGGHGGTRSDVSPASAWTIPLASEAARRSEEHTSELQSRQYLVCRLLLAKKKQTPISLLHVVTLPNAISC